MNQQLSSCSAVQLRRAAAIQEKIEALRAELAAVLGAVATPEAAPDEKRRTMSAAARARISAAQKARWAERKGSKVAPVSAKQKRRISPEGRRRISEGARARWARFRAARAKAA